MKKQIFFIELVILQTFGTIRASEYFKYTAAGTAILLGMYGLKALHESGELDRAIDRLASAIVSLSESDTTQTNSIAISLIQRQKTTQIHYLINERNNFSHLNNRIDILQTGHSIRMERLAVTIMRPFQPRHPLQSKTIDLTRRINNQIEYINHFITSIHHNQEDNLTDNQIDEICNVITVLKQNFELLGAEYNQLVQEGIHLTDQDLLAAMSNSPQ